MSQDERPAKDLDDWTPADFARELFGGKLRWIAAVLAAVSIVALVYQLSDPAAFNDPFLPFLPQAAAGWEIPVAAVIWVALAAINWSAHLRDRAER